MRLRENTANFVTLLNLICGFAAIIALFNTRIDIACYLVILGGVFDFFDGFVARGLKVSSELGKQLDSLADVVTFGVVPGFVAYILIDHSLLMYNENYGALLQLKIQNWLPFLIPVFSAYRLGKFNIDTRQTKSFLGLPTPANALFWISLPLITNPLALSIVQHPVFLIASCIVTSVLMVSELPLFSMKFDKFTWKGNQLKFSFLLFSIFLFAIFTFAAAPIILLLYIIFSILHNYTSKHEIQS